SQYELVRDEIEKINPVGVKALDALQRIRSTPVISDIFDFISTHSFLGAFSLLMDLPLLVGDTLMKLDDLILQVNALKKQAIPKLFQGIDNEFFDDGMVAELKAHYKIIDENKEVVTHQIVTFGTQVTYVSKELEKADKLLTATQQMERVAAPPATSDFTL
ncbi:hypothetical protein HB769_14265, partial [Listeria welshimeri]|nr:hypothetical protein [Listeria welshimeri]